MIKPPSELELLEVSPVYEEFVQIKYKQFQEDRQLWNHFGGGVEEGKRSSIYFLFDY